MVKLKCSGKISVPLCNVIFLTFSNLLVNVCSFAVFGQNKLSTTHTVRWWDIKIAILIFKIKWTEFIRHCFRNKFVLFLTFVMHKYFIKFIIYFSHIVNTVFIKHTHIHCNWINFVCIFLYLIWKFCSVMRRPAR